MSFTHFDPTALTALQQWRAEGSCDNRDRVERLLTNLPLAMEQELTERQRTLLTMHFFQGLTVSQIAEQLGLSKSTVSRSLSRATEKLFCALRYSL